MLDPPESLQFAIRELIDGARPRRLKEGLEGCGEIEAAVTDERGIDSVSERVERPRRRLARRARPGYRITVHRDLHRFFADVAGLLSARSEIVSATGEVRAPADLTHAEAAAALQGAIDTYVRSGEWRPPQELWGADYRRMLRQQENPSEPMKALMQMGEDMAVFVAAHELGHILLGHCDGPAPSTTGEHWEDELEADRTAAALLPGYYRQQVAWSPSFSTAAKPVVFEMAVSKATIAVAVLFELLYLFSEHARQLGRTWTRSHPPGDLRYQSFRAFNLEQLGRPETVFTTGMGLGSPDSTRLLFRELAAGLVS